MLCVVSECGGYLGLRDYSRVYSDSISIEATIKSAKWYTGVSKPIKTAHEWSDTSGSFEQYHV